MARNLQFFSFMLLCLVVTSIAARTQCTQCTSTHHQKDQWWKADPREGVHSGRHDSVPTVSGKEFLSLQAVANCSLHPVTNDLPSPLPEALTDALNTVENYLTSLLNSKNLPGIAYSVTYKGTTLKSGGVGVMNKTNSDVPDSNTIFRIGSVTKVFAVLTLFQVFAQRQIASLDDPLVTYCPGFSMMTDFNITLKQMAAQMSGLPREAPCGPPDELNLCPLTTSQILQGLKSERLIHPPWTTPTYSNLAYSLLGNCLVEKFYPSLTFKQYVHKYILEPLGMTQTGFTSSSNEMATGYNADGSPALLYDFGWTSPAAQMYSTTRDLDNLARFFMSNDVNNTVDDSVLPLSLKREMLLQLYSNSDGLTGFGAPWEIMFQENYTVLNKGGNIPGFSTLFSFVPELQLGLNILFSGPATVLIVSYEAYHVLIPALVETLTPVQTLYPYPPDPQVYEGAYNGSGGVEALIEGKPEFNITTYQNQLLMSGPFNAFLAYREPLNLQIVFPDNTQPCIVQELLGIKEQWVIFAPPVNGKSPSFTIPGLYNNVVFKRISSQSD